MRGAENRHHLRDHLSKGGLLELSLGCADIPRMDVLSQSDPFCVTYVDTDNGWNKLATTETYQDKTACKWASKLYIDEELAGAKLKFEVYDRDTDRDLLKEQDFIGYAEGKFICSMLEKGESHRKVEIIRSSAKKQLGWISLTIDWLQKPSVDFKVTLEVIAECPSRKKLHYEILRKCAESSQYVLVLHSQLLTKKDTHFETNTFSLTQLCGGSLSRMFRIELTENLGHGKTRSLGFARTSLDEFMQMDGKQTLLWNSHGKKSLQNPTVSVTKKGEDSTTQNEVFRICIRE